MDINSIIQSFWSYAAIKALFLLALTTVIGFALWRFAEIVESGFGNRAHRIPGATDREFMLRNLFVAHMGKGEISGRDLRRELAVNGVKMNAPQFYSMMSQAEDDGHVASRDEVKVVADQPVKERLFRITGRGIFAIGEPSK